MKPKGCTVEVRCVVGETGAVRQGGAPVEFTLLHVEGFAVKGRDEGGVSPHLVPDGTRSTVTLRRPPDEVESVVVEFACPTCGRTVSARVRSRAECSRLRRGRLARGLAALLAAVLAVWMLIDTVTAGAEGGEILFCMVVATGSPLAAIYGAFWTTTALAGKGIAIEGEPEPLEMAGALGPQDQFHVDGARFVKHSV
jgi:hypothetical protein